MKETLDVRDELLRMRGDLLNRLVALASDKKQAQHCLEQFTQIEKMIESAGVGGARFGRYKAASVAVKHYLDQIGHAVPQKEIEEALLAGGFRGGADDARTRIRQSIKSFLEGHLRDSKTLREMNGLIGRWEWGDELFRQ